MSVRGILNRLLRAILFPFIEEVLDPLRKDIYSDTLKTAHRLVQLRTLSQEQEAALRRDMALEMQRVGQALAATNHQVVMLQHEITLMKLGTPTKIESVAPRTPGQVDWVPHPAHFGNKIDITR